MATTSGRRSTSELPAVLVPCAPCVTGRSAYIVRRHQQFLLACLRLLHTHLSRDHVMAQVGAAEVVGAARYLRAESRAALGLVASPDRASARAWHADDLLMAVLKEGAELRGLLVLDDPIDGQVPSDALKARLHEWTRGHVAEILASDERRRADLGLRHERRARRTAERENVEPADMIADEC